MSLGTVLSIAAVCLASALALLWARGGPAPVLVGLGVIALYNGLYTPLKGVTPTALLVGGVAGAAPPLLGWVAAGGPPGDYRILLMASVFYLWQIPHFALLARRHPGEHQAAGLRLARLAQTGPEGRWPLMVWLVGYGALVALAPALGLVSTLAAKAALGVMAVAVVLAGTAIPIREWVSYNLFNLSLVLFLACVITDAAWMGA